MKPSRQINLGPFRLDEANECLWRESTSIQLRPKAYAVLKYLIERAGTLVTKEELLESVWTDTFVGDAVLKDCIRQLREAFDDEPKSPQFIETVHRRGYRFIAGAINASDVVSREKKSRSSKPHESIATRQKPATEKTVLDREQALAQMDVWLDKAIEVEKQIVFVTGEAGIGKTTLVETFLNRARQVQNVWIATGQCLEQYGAGEAYLPMLDCLSRLGREASQQRIIELLREIAPTWLGQMPGLRWKAERDALREQFVGVTRERMLREMAELIETLTADVPLILVLEDLHWSDYSTLDLISYLARRRDASRLLLIGTYRPIEVILNEHPLRSVKLELQMHHLCNELPLEYLSPEAVAQFLALKFPKHRFPEALAAMIHQRTEGNPLFMINVIEYLIGERVIVQEQGGWELQANLDEVELDVPENILNLLEKHLDRLSPDEQRVLEGASVVGMDCSAVAISAGLAEDVLTIEKTCDSLARRHQFLHPAYIAELPDGTLTPRYRFIHALYLEVLNRRLAPTQRSQIHGRIGVRGEAIYGDRVDEIAAELAVHFEQARDNVRAVKYLTLAAENAARRSANYEVLRLARHGLELLETLPNTPEHARQKEDLLARFSQSRAATSRKLDAKQTF